MHFLVPAVFSGEFSTTDTESLADGYGHGPEGDPATDGHGPEAERADGHGPEADRRATDGHGPEADRARIGPSRSWVNWFSCVGIWAGACVANTHSMATHRSRLDGVR